MDMATGERRERPLRVPLHIEMTPDVRARLAAHTARWIDHAMGTAPCDRDRVRRGIEGLYAAAHLARPRVVIVASPYAMAMVYGAALAWWRRHGGATSEATSGATIGATRDAALAATSAATSDATRDATRAATSDATRGATRAATYGATSAATSDATYDATSAATLAATSGATRDAALAATSAATSDATRDAISDATRGATRDAISAATYDATSAATIAATYDATRDATLAATSGATSGATYGATIGATSAATYGATIGATIGATRDATSGATSDATSDAIDPWYVGIERFCTASGTPLEAALRAARSWSHAYHGGRMWSAYDCYLTAFRELGWLDLPEYRTYQHWLEAADAGFRCLHERFCVVSDNPDILRIDDQRRPHCDDGPSHRWRDGWCIYHIHGVRVDERIVMRPETITIADIDGERNAEVRRVMIDRYGVGRYLSDTGATVVSMDMVRVTAGGPSMPRALMRDRHGRQYLVGTDGSTSRTYYMLAPADARTCAEAHTAMAGIDDAAIIASS